MASSSSKDHDRTPTWVIASIATCFILISITLEKGIHKIEKWLRERKMKALLVVLERVTSELMILGFISLILSFWQSHFVRICIPAKVANIMLPCLSPEHPRELYLYEHRHLSADASSYQCKKGYEPLISANGLHQLHILIFFLAVHHVLYSAVTMLLGRRKIRGWKAWEEETSSPGPSRLLLTQETTFVRAHATLWTRIPVFFYVVCFFRQFYRSVGKADYLTLRNGFITVHLGPGNKFNFHKYIKRSLEDDFKVAVGVRPVLWAAFVVFLVLNVHGWYALVWTSLFPVLTILAVGTKLQAVLAKMAIEITESHAVVQEIPLVQGSDKYFWFGRPQLVLHLIHFALFQNVLQITHFLWIWYSFGLKNCFHADYKLAIVKGALGVGVLCLCSYITLPLYAIVTQMSSKTKKSILDEQISQALKQWHKAMKMKLGLKLGNVRTMDGRATDSTMHSFGPTLHRFSTSSSLTHTMSIYGSQDTDDYQLADMDEDDYQSANTELSPPSHPPCHQLHT